VGHSYGQWRPAFVIDAESSNSIGDYGRKVQLCEHWRGGEQGVFRCCGGAVIYLENLKDDLPRRLYHKMIKIVLGSRVFKLNAGVKKTYQLKLTTLQNSTYSDRFEVKLSIKFTVLKCY
jgi:hypothetical protein